MPLFFPFLFFTLCSQNLLSLSLSNLGLIQNAFMKHQLDARHFTVCEKYDHQEIHLNLIKFY